MTLPELFDLAHDRQAVAVHLASRETPRLRIRDRLVPLEGVDAEGPLSDFLTPETDARLRAGVPVERAFVRRGLVFNAFAFRSGEGIVATFRILPQAIPAFETVMEGAEPFFEGLAACARGLVLIAGPTGSGKTTTALALMDRINADRAARIFVVGAGASHVFESRKGLLTHLRVGQDCESGARGLEIAAASDADVVATDDLPDFETLRRALVLVDRGTLVIANLPAESAVEAVRRLLDAAGDEAPALRRALAEGLVAVTAQRLVPSADGARRVPVYEWIANSPAIRAALVDGDLSAVQRVDPACMTSERMAKDLFLKGRIALETATALRDPEGG